MSSMDIQFLALVSEEKWVFSNHVVTAKKNGDVVVVKVIAQFELKEGRIFRCDELTRLISDATEDHDLGSRH